MLNEKGEMPGEEELVEVPAWRYAMINYPHALLSNGLSILDTPGLNALGMEPELTVSTVPNAHAILFLLSIDTGVTKSDLEIWDRYVKQGLPQKVAVLNKVDLMWGRAQDPGGEVDKAVSRMVDTTAQHLHIPRERIFALSAQKALLGKIREDAGLVRKSGIEQLEKFMAEEIVPMKRQILCKAVVNEIGGMMNSSRASIAKKQQANQAEVQELNGLVGKSKQVVQGPVGQDHRREERVQRGARGVQGQPRAVHGQAHRRSWTSSTRRSSTRRSPTAPRRSRTRGPPWACSAA
jgi:hypothetical protein